MLDDAVDERIVRDAERNASSISEVLRVYVEAGIRLADELEDGYDEAEVRDPDFP